MDKAIIVGALAAFAFYGVLILFGFAKDLYYRFVNRNVIYSDLLTPELREDF